MTLIEIHEKIVKLNEAQRKLVIEMLDGRSQAWLSEHTGISKVRLNSIINGKYEFTPAEITKINSVLNR